MKGGYRFAELNNSENLDIFLLKMKVQKQNSQLQTACLFEDIGLNLRESLVREKLSDFFYLCFLKGNL